MSLFCLYTWKVLLLDKEYYNFPVDLVVKNPLASAGDVGSIIESGRYPAEGNGNPC